MLLGAMKHRLGRAAVGMIFCTGCVTQGSASGASGAPQTATPVAASPAGPVATLSGAVKLIDGEYAPNTGEPIEVPAGCHVLKTRDDMIVQTSEVEVRGTITPVDIVVPMRAGYRYLVERKIENPTQSMSQVAIFAREMDPSDATTQLFWPVKDPGQLAACRPNATPPQDVPGVAVR